MVAAAVAAAVSDAPVDLAVERSSDRREALQKTPANGLTCGAEWIRSASPSASSTDRTVPVRGALVSAAGSGVDSCDDRRRDWFHRRRRDARSVVRRDSRGRSVGLRTGNSGRAATRSIVAPTVVRRGRGGVDPGRLSADEPRAFACLPAWPLDGESPPALSDWLFDDAALPVSA